VPRVWCVHDSCMHILSIIPHRKKYTTMRSGDRAGHICKIATSSLINTLRFIVIAQASKLHDVSFSRLPGSTPHSHPSIAEQNCILNCASRPCATLYVMLSHCLHFLYSTRWEEQCVIVQHKTPAVLYEFAHLNHIYTFLHLDRLHSIRNTA